MIEKMHIFREFIPDHEDFVLGMSLAIFVTFASLCT